MTSPLMSERSSSAFCTAPLWFPNFSASCTSAMRSSSVMLSIAQSDPFLSSRQKVANLGGGGGLVPIQLGGEIQICSPLVSPSVALLLVPVTQIFSAHSSSSVLLLATAQRKIVMA